MARKIDVPKGKFSMEGIKKSLRIFGFIAPYKVPFIIGMVFLVLSSSASLSFPYFTGQLFDSSKVTTENSLNRIAIMLGFILIAQAIFSYFRTWLFSLVTEKVSADLRFALYKKLVYLPVPFFDSNRTGELSSRINNDVSQIQDTLSSTLAEFFRQIATLVVGITIITFLTPKLTIFMLATFPILVVAALIFGRFIRKLSKQKQDELATANIVVEETLQAIRTVKAFTSQLFELMRYRKALDSSVATALKSARYRSAFVSFIIFAIFGGIVLVIWYGSLLVFRKELSIGQLTTFILYTAFIGGAVGGLGDLYSTLQKTIGSSERILEILDSPQEEENEEDEKGNRKRLTGNIEFKNVEFSYPSRLDTVVLNKISFSVEQGKTMAIVGQSGSGKSTITQLLLRYYDKNSGEILIDGLPIEEIPLKFLRSQMGIVPQDTFLFGGSIKENIMYSKPTSNLEEIKLAAKKANALEFIESFPEGFDTIVGERGIQLSGGQRQRISIARAILKDPSILILDEATSSLDAGSEHLVQEALIELMKNRTCIVIAHRLSTIKNADKIIVLAKGKIEEMGTHQELLSNLEGLYSTLIKMQL